MVTTHNDLDYDEIVQKLIQMADAFDRDFCQAGPVLRFEMEAHFRYLLCLAEASLVISRSISDSSIRRLPSSHIMVMLYTHDLGGQCEHVVLDLIYVGSQPCALRRLLSAEGCDRVHSTSPMLCEDGAAVRHE
ncbi:unnamed protein product [Mesocestoides corti]|uniref:Protein UL91 n=1 Tax=Mesocestoides corti TaxID=53468 RepID=A0A0R3U8W2_MESCO|nr:unnamed protein product [Mesocestoides corti]